MKISAEPKFLLQVLRISLGLGLVVGGFKVGAGDTLKSMLLGLFLVVSGGFFFGPELCLLILDPVSRIISGFIYPEEHGKLPLDYTLPRFYRKKERLPEALEHYRRILHYYPKDLTAYMEGIEVAWELEEATEAERMYKRGRRKLSEPDRTALALHWQAVCVGTEA